MKTDKGIVDHLEFRIAQQFIMVSNDPYCYGRIYADPVGQIFMTIYEEKHVVHVLYISDVGGSNINIKGIGIAQISKELFSNNMKYIGKVYNLGL